MDCVKGKRKKFNVRDLVLSSLFIALVYVSTTINFVLPIDANGGLVHIGTPILYIIAIMFGKYHGAIAGGIGMGLFDLLSMWAIWTPGTLVVRWIMGYMVGAIANGNGRKGNSVIWNVVAILAGGIWMIAGYYLYNAIFLAKSFIVPITSIPGDVLQVVAGLVIALVAVPALKQIKAFDKYIR